MTVLERLAHRVECVSRELQHLVEEEHPEMGETYLAGSGRRAAADETCRRDRMVGRAEWPYRRERALRQEYSGNGMHRDHFQRLVLGECR